MSNQSDIKKPMSFEEAMAALKSERDYQLRRWGYRQADGSMKEAEHSVCDWLVYIQHYLDEAFRKASKEAGNEAAMDMLRKVTAMGVAACEQNGVPFRNLDVEVTNGRDGLPA